MYTIKVDLDCVEAILRSVLLEDYKGICSEIRTLQEDEDALKEFQKEDLQFNLEFKKGFEILLRYYFPLNEAEEYIKEYDNV